MQNVMIGVSIGYTGNRTSDDLYNIAYLLMNDGKHVRIDGAEVLTNLDYIKTLKLVGQNWIMTNGLRIYSEPNIIDLLMDNNIDTVYISYHIIMVFKRIQILFL